MYTPVSHPVAWIDVEWTSLDVGGPDEASVQVQRSIRLKVKLLPRSKMLAMLNGTEQKDVSVLALEVATDWAGVVDEDKRLLPFDAAVLEQIIEHEPGFAAGFDISYVKAALGQGKVREGNSESSRPGGRAAEEAAGTKPAPQSS